MREQSRLTGIYVILDADAYGATIVSAAAEILAGGARLLQYRAKSGADLVTLIELQRLSAKFHAVLFINDHIGALQYGDGMHLGQSDIAEHNAPYWRERVGDKYLGISAHTIDQAREQVGFADYLGVGPFRTTTSKLVTRPPLGLAQTQAIVAETSLPVCAIGGITLADIGPLRAANVAMVAVIGAIAQAADRRAATQAFCDAWLQSAATRPIG